ncbi:MAG: DUF1501 domain-containing protein [Acidimicrobiales bacterium]
MSRRRFLALAGGAASAGVLGATLGPRAWDEMFGRPTSAAADGSSGQGRLVLLTLYGGNDGLNTVVPYEDSLYHSSRGILAIDPSTILPLGDGFGLHPSLPGLKKLWDARHLAVVQGVGFADPNYSHFESMDIWQSGVPSEPVSTGWIGRWLDTTAGSPLRAVGIGPTTPMALTGAKVQGVTIPAGKLILPGDPTEEALYATLAGTALHEALLLKESAHSNGDLLQVQRSLGPILDRSASSNPLHLDPNPGSSSASADAGQALAIANGGGGLSSSGILATQLSLVANLILAGATTQVYSVELGGFDTHADQGPTQKTLLSQLDTAVSAFVDAMSNGPRGRATTMIIYTEFGRRVAANASAGTDHGWANVMFATGPSVKGGWYGEPPSLSKLSEGNSVYTTDFRSPYATVLDRILGVDPSAFLQGSFPTMAFV